MSIAANFGTHDCLRYLNITSPPLGDEGLRILASSFTPHLTFAKSDSLKTKQTDINSDQQKGLIALYFSPALMTPQKFANLARFARLRSLCLHYPPLSLIGAYREAVKKLKHLIALRFVGALGKAAIHKCF